MEAETIMGECLQYIDRNLETKLSAADISSAMGYSEFHFSRMFKADMGIPVMEYVKKRKLIKASEAILHGDKIIDAALKYGWQSHSGFTKAFKNEFGFCPEFLRAMMIGIDCLRRDGMNHVFLKSTDVHAEKKQLKILLREEMERTGVPLEPDEFERIYTCACDTYDGLRRYSGDEYVTHPLNTAIILAQMTADKNIIYAGLFCDALKKTGVTMGQLRKELPKTVVSVIERANGIGPAEMEACEDEEAVMVRLAERLHNMRTVEFMDAQRREEKTKETLKLVLHMAGKVKNKKLLEELNDLSLKAILWEE